MRKTSVRELHIRTSELAGNESQLDVRRGVSWVGLLPQLVGLRRLVQLSRRKHVVVPLDGEPLPFAHLLPQRVSLAYILRPPPYFVETEVDPRHIDIWHGKIGIKLYRPFEKR